MIKNISFKNEVVLTMLAESCNTSQLIEEALLFFRYAIDNQLLSTREIQKLQAQKLIK